MAFKETERRKTRTSRLCPAGKEGTVSQKEREGKIKLLNILRANENERGTTGDKHRLDNKKSACGKSNLR